MDLMYAYVAYFNVGLNIRLEILTSDICLHLIVHKPIVFWKIAKSVNLMRSGRRPKLGDEFQVEEVSFKI